MHCSIHRVKTNALNKRLWSWSDGKSIISSLRRFFSDEQNYFELVKKREVLFFQLEEH